MVNHFAKLQTPLKNIETYPRLLDQVQRFSKAGWPFVQARSLWDIFHDPHFVTYEERIALDEVEAFDEWEELVLFASHYFLLVAKQGPDIKLTRTSPIEEIQSPVMASNKGECLVHASVSSRPCQGKRFGAIIQEGFVHPQIGHVAGLGPQTRTATTNIYMVANETEMKLREDFEPTRGVDRERIVLPSGCESRMCHTTSSTRFYEGDWLLVGGRKSPDQPLKDCWLLRNQRWQRVGDLPIPLYRHCQTTVEVRQEDGKSCSAILVYGGKTSKNIVSGMWLLWRDSAGWVEVMADNIQLVPRFGAAMISCGYSKGIILGGMSKDGMICKDLLHWTIVYLEARGWRIELTEPVISEDESDAQALKYLHRLGASLEDTHSGYLLIGGVADTIIPECCEIIKIWSIGGSPFADREVLFVRRLVSKLPDPRPLLVGHSSLSRFGQAIILGGGAVCFSFGTHWNVAPLSICALPPYIDDQKPYELCPFERPDAVTIRSITSMAEFSGTSGQTVAEGE